MGDRRVLPRQSAAIVILVMVGLPCSVWAWGSLPVVRLGGSYFGAVGNQMSLRSRSYGSGKHEADVCTSWSSRVGFAEGRRGKKTSGSLNLKAQRLVPEEEVEAEIKVKNSRFIGSIAHTPTVEAAREYIASLKQRYPDGRHHCYAFSIGHGSSVTQGMSDDGEPSGTAGRPMLAVLSGSGIGDATAVVTRYSGGTKLGTGGLVKAYTEATQAALLELSVVEKVERVLVAVKGLDYQFYSKIKGPVEAMTATVVKEEFADDVNLVLSIEEERAAEVKDFINDATSGQAEIEDLAHEDVTS